MELSPELVQGFLLGLATNAVYDCVKLAASGLRFAIVRATLDVRERISRARMARQVARLLRDESAVATAYLELLTEREQVERRRAALQSRVEA